MPHQHECHSPSLEKLQAALTRIKHDVHADEVEEGLAEDVPFHHGQVPQTLQDLDQMLVSGDERRQRGGGGREGGGVWLLFSLSPAR